MIPLIVHGTWKWEKCASDGCHTWTVDPTPQCFWHRPLNERMAQSHRMTYRKIPVFLHFEIFKKTFPDGYETFGSRNSSVIFVGQLFSSLLNWEINAYLPWNAFSLISLTTFSALKEPWKACKKTDRPPPSFTVHMAYIMGQWFSPALC